MNLSTVNISIKKELLKKIDDVAREESRSRSELIREAARMYVERKNKWKTIFEYADKAREIHGYTENLVAEEIENYRKGNKK
jgi:metal-responsive CopG/Arc/MetJ family transcriptional regulator